MTLKKENYTYILNEFLINISTYADKKYQIRVWIKGEGPFGPDFDEDVNCFFNKWDIIEQEGYKRFDISDEQYRLLVNFKNEFDKFCDDNDFPEEFIDTPEWKKIMDLAKEVLKAFNFTQKLEDSSS